MDFSLLVTPENLTWVKQQFGEHPPKWLLAVAALIPFCIILFLREIWCWIWKINQIASSLKKIERHLRMQVEFIEQRKPLSEKTERPLAERAIVGDKKFGVDPLNPPPGGSRITQRDN